MTLPPTDLPTIKPTWAGMADAERSEAGVAAELSAVAFDRYTTIPPVRARRPWRVAAVKSDFDFIRCAAGSMISWPGAARVPGSAAGSGRQFAAALAATGRQNGATGTRPHPKPEAVGLGPTAVVRLEGPLAHGLAPSLQVVVGGHEGSRARRWPRVAILSTSRTAQAVLSWKKNSTRSLNGTDRPPSRSN
jgi:hypothetical protein